MVVMNFSPSQRDNRFTEKQIMTNFLYCLLLHSCVQREIMCYYLNCSSNNDNHLNIIAVMIAWLYYADNVTSLQAVRWLKKKETVLQCRHLLQWTFVLKNITLVCKSDVCHILSVQFIYGFFLLLMFPANVPRRDNPVLPFLKVHLVPETFSNCKFLFLNA